MKILTTLRDETEWVETVEAGGNILTGADEAKIVETVRKFQFSKKRKPLYGEGGVAAGCVARLESFKTAC